MKKLVSFTLAAALILASLFALAGCGDGDFPVTVANLTIDKAPAAITVLDPSVADIISYIGYDTSMVCRSDEVDMKYMQVVPSAGSQAKPDIQKIVSHSTEIVFADSSLADDVKANIEDRGIKVVRVTIADDAKQLETNYRTLGKILGGAVTGDNKGAQAYSKLIDSMAKLKASVGSSDVLYTTCYLYLDDTGHLCHTTSGTYGDMLLGSTGAVNVAVNIEDKNVDVATLKVANPNFIFYADEATLKYIEGDGVLSKLDAVKNKKLCEISRAEMTRQGFTALETIQKMIDFMHPEKAATPDSAKTSATPAATEATKSTQPATQAATKTESATQPATKAQGETQPETSTESVAEKYKIDVKDLSLKYEDDNDNVKAMQQRLFDLGYVDDKENITGYYGDISKAAVTEFQKKNGIKETGTADNETLKKLFSSDAKKK